jgi:hypothetical protein
MEMKKWVLSGIGYLLVVIVGYFIYASITSNEASVDHGSHVKNETADSGSSHHTGHDEENEKDDHGKHGDHSDNSDSEVNVDISYQDTTVKISITDLQGEPFDELQVNHEKLLHLIIVDEHLEQYLHLHPEKVESGVYVLEQPLKDGAYKAFVDIKPRDKEYVLHPLSFTVGAGGEIHGHIPLQVDTDFKKTVNDVSVSLNVSSFKSDEEVQLVFQLEEGTNVQPYLGAMGHVVILDEAAERYIHVHPLNDKDTIFETAFSDSGIYKLWGEFKINEQVYTYPFVIEIK